MPSLVLHVDGPRVIVGMQRAKAASSYAYASGDPGGLAVNGDEELGMDVHGQIPVVYALGQGISLAPAASGDKEDQGEQAEAEGP